MEKAQEILLVRMTILQAKGIGSLINSSKRGVLKTNRDDPCRMGKEMARTLRGDE